MCWLIFAGPSKSLIFSQIFDFLNFDVFLKFAAVNFRAKDFRVLKLNTSNYGVEPPAGSNRVIFRQTT